MQLSNHCIAGPPDEASRISPREGTSANANPTHGSFTVSRRLGRRQQITGEVGRSAFRSV